MTCGNTLRFQIGQVVQTKNQACRQWHGHLDSKKIEKKNQEKEGKNWEREEKSGRQCKNQEGSFTLLLVTDGARYTTACYPGVLYIEGYYRQVLGRTRMHIILSGNFGFC